jgi:hypothetical protein
MRSLSTNEVSNVSGGGLGLGLGLLAGIKVALPPLLKISVGAGLGVSTGGSSCNSHGHSGHC